MFLQLLPPPVLGIFIISGVLGLLGTIFWLWMLIDCILNTALVGTQKIIWVLVVLLLPFIGSLLYFFLARGGRTGTTRL